MNIKKSNVLVGGWLFFFLMCAGGLRVFAQTAPPEMVLIDFYKGYVRAINKNVDPLGKSSPLRKYLSARLTAQKIKAFEKRNGADYFFQSQEFFDSWENDFTVSPPIVKGANAAAIVTFPGDYPRVKVTLVKESGAWKILGVQNAPQ
jgi:hypothetical protein